MIPAFLCPVCFEAHESPCRAVAQASAIIGWRAEKMRPHLFYDERCAVSDLLFTIQTTCPQSARVVQRDLIEKTSRADFEMWFRSGGRYLGFRVQAKMHQAPESNDYGKVNKPSTTQPTATPGYPAPSTVFQVDDLINGCVKLDQKPLYVFFERSSLASKHPARTPGVDDHLWGCSMAGAQKIQKLVYANPSGTIPDTTIMPLLRPLTDLVCRAGDGTLVERVLAAFGATFDAEVAPVITDNPPSYVLALQRSDGIVNSATILEGVPINALLLFTERESRSQ